MLSVRINYSSAALKIIVKTEPMFEQLHDQTAHEAHTR